MNTNFKVIGSLLTGFALVLLIILAFVKTDVDKQSAVLCQTYEKANLDMNTCPAHQSNFSWMIVLAFGVGFLLLGVGVYFFLLHRTSFIEEKTSFKSVDTSKLDEEEKTIYDFLKSKEGSVYQTDLIKETNFSKVKITRLLDKMETKGIVERKRRGMTNLIVLR